jgi:hypothetical protein
VSVKGVAIAAAAFCVVTCGTIAGLYTFTDVLPHHNSGSVADESVGREHNNRDEGNEAEVADEIEQPSFSIPDFDIDVPSFPNIGDEPNPPNAPETTGQTLSGRYVSALQLMEGMPPIIMEEHWLYFDGNLMTINSQESNEEGILYAIGGDNRFVFPEVPEFGELFEIEVNADRTQVIMRYLTIPNPFPLPGQGEFVEQLFIYAG